MEKINLKLFHWASLTTTQKILLGGFFIALCCIGIGFISGLKFGDSDYNFLGKKDQQKLSIDKPLTQVFTAKKNGLSEVKFHIGNQNLWPGEAIRFELRDARCENILATDSWTPLHGKPLIYTRFDFSQIPDSAEKQYCAYIVYTSPLERKSSDAPHINTNKSLGQSFTATAKNKVYENETLQMRPAYDSGLPSDAWQLVERMSQYKPEYIKGLPLLILLTITVLGSIALGIWIVFAKDSHP
jgi:hypothetical protein